MRNIFSFKKRAAPTAPTLLDVNAPTEGSSDVGTVEGAHTETDKPIAEQRAQPVIHDQVAVSSLETQEAAVDTVQDAVHDATHDTVQDATHDAAPGLVQDGSQNDPQDAPQEPKPEGEQVQSEASQDELPSWRVAVRERLGRQAKSTSERSIVSARGPVIRAVPIRVLIGFLANSTERDALEYTLGLVHKHFTQIGISHYEVFPYKDGFVYEAHEGGTGKAYTPSIINLFEATGPYNASSPALAVIATSSRMVQVQRTREGLEAVWLPDGANVQHTEGLEPTEDMRPVINKRTGFLVVGATLFLTGFIAMILSGLLFRFQPYEVPKSTEAEISYANLPIGQYKQVISNFSSSSQRIVKVEYKNKQWQSPEVEKIVDTAATSTTVSSSASAPLASAPAAQPALPSSSPVAGNVPGGPLPLDPQANTGRPADVGNGNLSNNAQPGVTP